MAEANCIPPDELNDQGEVTDDVIDDVTPDDGQPAQDDLEDWNYNYTNNEEDPTNRLDADGNILAAPLEMWEIQNPTTVTIPGFPEGTEITLPGYQTLRLQAWNSPVSFNYFPYGNDEIDEQTPVPESRVEEFNGKTYRYKTSDALAADTEQGYALVTVGESLLVLDPDTTDIVAVWDFEVADDNQNLVQERHPWFKYRLFEPGKSDPNIDLGRLDEDPSCSQI